MLHIPFRILVTIALASISPLTAQQNELRSLANELGTDIAAAGKKSIAVVDFTDLQGNPTDLGRFLSEEFSVALTRTHKGFEVIDRAHLKAILTEHKLASSGLIDPATAKKLGQIVGADALVTGSMTPFSESVRIAVKVITTDTARIIAADTADLPKTKTITELIGSRTASDTSAVTIDYRDLQATPPGGTVPSRPTQQSNGGELPKPAHTVMNRRSTVIAEEFVYEMPDCRGVGGSIRCSFNITNRGPDRYLMHACCDHSEPNFPTVAFDNFGTRATGGECSISNGERVLNRFCDPVKAQLISGISVPASILFRDMNESASSMPRLTIHAGVSVEPNGMVRDFEITFRNVPIRR